jgi:hypothetical protein
VHVNSRIHRFPCREGRRAVQMVAFRQPRRCDDGSRLFSSRVLPNGSRLSCGRNARRRKEAEPQTKTLASEATQFLPTCERPSASSAC